MPDVGRLGLIDGASLLEFSFLNELKKVQPEVVDRFARQAEALAARFADYDTGKVGYIEDMRDALHSIAEQLVVKFSEVPRRIEAIGVLAETQGPHSFTLRGRVSDFIPPYALDILNYYASSTTKHSATFTKVFASPLLTDAGENTDRITREDEEVDIPFIEFDENVL